MTVRFQSVLGALALLALTVAPAAVLGQQGQNPEMAKQKQTIVDIRNVGTAMFSWLTDQVAAQKKHEGTSEKPKKETEEPTSVNMGDVPEISREDLAKVLVPTYIASLPEKDGWGNPYEFHLNVKEPMSYHVMGIRSGGRDGQFSGSVYEIGSFTPEDFDQDISWSDGYFVRWPQRK